MKFKQALLAVIAMATPIAANAVTVVNGDFQSGYTSNTEFGASYPGGAGPTGWAATGYALYFDGSNASTQNAAGQYASSGVEKLWAKLPSSASNGLTTNAIFGASGNHFVALDGDATAGVAASIWQTIGGLTVNDTYEVSFNWAAAQLQSRTGATTETLQVTFGGSTQTTSVLSNQSQGFVDGGLAKLSFIASSASQVLTFLSVGSPVGLPPIALLDNITVTDKTVHASVPEPSTWAIMLTGFGALAFFARRRRGGFSDIA